MISYLNRTLNDEIKNINNPNDPNDEVEFTMQEKYSQITEHNTRLDSLKESNKKIITLLENAEQNIEIAAKTYFKQYLKNGSHINYQYYYTFYNMVDITIKLNDSSKKELKKINLQYRKNKLYVETKNEWVQVT